MIEAEVISYDDDRHKSYDLSASDDHHQQQQRTATNEQKRILFPVPSRLQRENQLYTKSQEDPNSASTTKAKRLKKNKKSPSFIINHPPSHCNFNSGSQHEHTKECSTSYSHRQQTTTKLSLSSTSSPFQPKRGCGLLRVSYTSSSSGNNKRTHNSSNYDDHHRNCQCQLGTVLPKIRHKSRRLRKSLAGLSPRGGTLILALLAVSCLFPSFILAIASQPSSDLRTGDSNGDADAGTTSDFTMDEDFYSTTPALSQQIPFSAIHNASSTTTTTTTKTKNSNINNESVQLAEKQARATTAKRAARLGGPSRVPPVPISESELLPFNEFIIQPAAFSDLMKSWPPTTLRAAASSLASAADSQANRQRQHQQKQSSSSSSSNNPIVSLHQPKKQQNSQKDHDGHDLRSALLMRNHLNEDLDDTIVTADQSFERELSSEPETWINYLGDLGDYIYLQLKHYLEKTTTSASRLAAGTNNKSLNSNNNNNNGNSNKEDPSDSTSQQQPTARRSSQLKMETIDELLDDYYYDQYENSQVLYYGAQLVREHESFEIGCFLPIDQRAEWTKSGKPLPPDGQGSPRTIKRNLFLNAKQNFTLKVFTASLSDSGNYRCSKMSRKFHKLIVVPDGASLNQIHAIQQRLLSVVSPAKMSEADSRFYQFKRTLRGSLAAVIAGRPSSANQLVPGYSIVDNEPLVVNCNISDPFVLQRLKENPQFRLAWYKNGKQLPGSRIAPPPTAMPSTSNHHPHRGAATAARQIGSGTNQTPTNQQPRIQFLDLNGRKLFISAASYGDAGEYLCSWSNLPAREMSAPEEDETSSELLATNGNNNNDQLAVAPAPNAAALVSNDQLEALSRNPLAAGSLSQLMVPVKLRPFKSTYHVRNGNQLRLVCQLQRGYPQAQLNWYVGNSLVDADFLKEHGGRYRILYLQNQNQLGALVAPQDGSGGSESQRQPANSASDSNNGDSVNGDRPKIVEINPIPTGKLQMQLTQDGKWVEYRELDDEKATIDTSEQQLRYMQQKFTRLTGINISGSNAQQSRAVDADTLATQNQISLSVLIIDALDIEKDTMRYACRATNRANTDEVTTVIRVQASSTVATRPSTGRATLVYGQNLNFQCDIEGQENAQFWWFRYNWTADISEFLEPMVNDHIEIHNNRLQLVNPNYDYVGDYICKKTFLHPVTNMTKIDHNETATIRVRTQPVIEDFRIDTSHTGKSSTIRDGDRLELYCSVYDKLTPVNITWLRSLTSDDESNLIVLREDLEITTTMPPTATGKPWNQEGEDFSFEVPTHYVGRNQHGIEIQTVDPFTKKLVIESVSQEHRGYYACVADNGITERTKKIVFVRVKDSLIALWPFLGILAEFFILFTIIKIWETQRFNYTYGPSSATATAAAGTGPASSRGLLANKGSAASR